MASWKTLLSHPEKIRSILTFVSTARIEKKMANLKSILISITGDVDLIGSERYFVTITCFTSTIFLAGLTCVHLLMNLSVAPAIIAGISSLVILGLYFLVRFRRCLFYPKLILSLFGLVMLDLTWYTKFLSNGPVLFFYF